MPFTYAGHYGPEAIIDLRGEARLGATVTVYLSDGSTLATLYSDRTKASTASNPVYVDARGNLEFWADPGEYEVEVAHQGEVVARSDITVPLDPVELAGHLDDPTMAHLATAIGVNPTGALTATNVQGALEQLTQSDVSQHVAEETDAHDASAISFVAAGSISSVNVQAALEELDADVQAGAGLAAHISDASDAHDASAISFSTTGGLSSTDVQAALAELDSEKATTGSVTTVASNLSTHEADTTNVHGIADTSILETTTGSAAKVATHEADTTSVHGITDTAQVALKNAANSFSGTQTFASISLGSTAFIVQNGGVNATNPLLQSKVSGDDASSFRLRVNYDGKIIWGAGGTSGAGDTNLYRSGANALKTDDALDVVGALTQNGSAVALQSALDAHLADTVDAHDATAISFAPAGSIAATTVQAAIEEVASEAGGGGALDDLSDVTITAAASGDFIRYNGSAWVDTPLADGDIPAAIARDAEVAAAYQPLDSDLTAIAGLSPTNDDVVQRKSGAWTNRTMAQVKTDLALVKGDVGLGNVDNTSDANKPVSTATQTALDLKANISTAVIDGDTAGGDLTGTYPSPTIAALAVTDAKVAAANKDGTAGTASMRTLGTGATQAAAGTHVHAASAVTYAGGTGMSATDVEAAIDELATEKSDTTHTHDTRYERMFTLGKAGAIPAAAEDIGDFNVPVGFNSTAVRVKATVLTAVSTDTVFQVRRSTDAGASFADVSGFTVTIAAGAKRGVADPSNVDLDENDLLQVSKDSGTGGTNLLVGVVATAR